MVFAAEKKKKSVWTAMAGNDLTSKFLQGSGFAFTMLTQGFKAKGDHRTSFRACKHSLLTPALLPQGHTFLHGGVR